MVLVVVKTGDGLVEERNAAGRTVRSDEAQRFGRAVAGGACEVSLMGFHVYAT